MVWDLILSTQKMLDGWVDAWMEGRKTASRVTFLDEDIYGRVGRWMDRKEGRRIKEGRG